MLRFVLKRTQRAMFADKLADAANLAIGALVFGQSLSGGAFSAALALVGFALWVILLGYAVIVEGFEQ